MRSTEKTVSNFSSRFSPRTRLLSMPVTNMWVDIYSWISFENNSLLEIKAQIQAKLIPFFILIFLFPAHFCFIICWVAWSNDQMIYYILKIIYKLDQCNAPDQAASMVFSHLCNFKGGIPVCCQCFVVVVARAPNYSK